jgi:Family of unknown function (DUF6152)
MRRFLFVCLALAALAGSAPLLAHHSFAAEFDDKQPLKLTGTLMKVEWTNPHIWYYVDVKNPDGSTTTWALSGGAPGQLMRRGIRKEQLVVGSVVNVEGFRAKDGSHNGFGSRVTYADGRNVFTATPLDRQSTPPAAK